MEEKVIKEEKESEVQQLAKALEQLKNDKQEKAKQLANCMFIITFIVISILTNVFSNTISKISPCNNGTNRGL